MAKAKQDPHQTPPKAEGETEGAAEGEVGETAPAGKNKKKLILLAVPVLLVAIGAGLWFSGILPNMLHGKPAATAAAQKGETGPPVFVDVPEMVTNLNVPGKRQSFIKFHAKLELGRKEDEAAVQAVMPRILDLFQTYVRDLRPEELRGSEGSYRLREELINRASIAAAPAEIRDVLFVEMVIE
jgi:flagellar FliL protein